MTEHELYKTGDADAPDAIKDRNGEVALNCCRKCGRGESDLTAKLRNVDPNWRAAQGVWRLIKEAADEIERLRSQGAGPLSRDNLTDKGQAT